jgi:predicted 2-oxoglutarate/Fe(II)-dependent dioxygenase YbiX
MRMNTPNTQLKDLIHVERGIIPANLCDYIVDEIETKEWRPHTWYNNVANSFGSEETKELDVQNITPELQQLLTPFMIQAGAAYNAKYHFECERTMQIMNKFSAIRFNRYSPDQIMRQHHDHIHSLFDGNEKGIPVLSFVGNLNDEYKGADLFFWDDYLVPLGKGDIIMFPSLFLFPHGVTEAIEGKRYSFVSWAW